MLSPLLSPPLSSPFFISFLTLPSSNFFSFFSSPHTNPPFIFSSPILSCYKKSIKIVLCVRAMSLLVFSSLRYSSSTPSSPPLSPLPLNAPRTRISAQADEALKTAFSRYSTRCKVIKREKWKNKNIAERMKERR